MKAASASKAAPLSVVRARSTAVRRGTWVVLQHGTHHVVKKSDSTDAVTRSKQQVVRNCTGGGKMRLLSPRNQGRWCTLTTMNRLAVHM